MKWLGAVLVLWGALEGFLLRRRERLLPLRVGQALAEDLEVLRCGVCLCRAPLPEILEHNLAEGEGARYLWGPLAALLSEAGERSLTGCWRQASRTLCGASWPRWALCSPQAGSAWRRPSRKQERSLPGSCGLSGRDRPQRGASPPLCASPGRAF